MSIEYFSSASTAEIMTTILVNVLISAALYAAFPLLFASLRKEPITKKKYNWICFGVNLIPEMIALVIAGKSSGGPYLLWTTVFAGVGVKNLASRGLLSSGTFDSSQSDKTVPVQASGGTSSENEDFPKAELPPQFSFPSTLETDAFIKLVASDATDYIEANRSIAESESADPDYGLVPEKPIYTALLDGQIEYLSSLRTLGGQTISWNRKGSTAVEGINGLVDIYETYLPSGKPYKTLYLNMYSDKTSKTPPAGFSILISGDDNSTEALPATGSILAQNNVDTAFPSFCRKCGAKLPDDSMFCYKCGTKIEPCNNTPLTSCVSLIVCSECGKEYSARAVACPDCGCPTPSKRGITNCPEPTGTETEISGTTPTKKNWTGLIIGILVLALTLVTFGYYTVKSGKLEAGRKALYSGDYITARKNLEGLHYLNSDALMIDCAFLEDLAVTTKHMMAAEEEDNYSVEMTLTEAWAKLKDYRYVTFSDNRLQSYVPEYLKNLERQINAYKNGDPNDLLASEWEAGAGAVRCEEILVYLNQQIGFLSGDLEFDEKYVKVLSSNQAYLNALFDLIEHGQDETKDAYCGTKYVERYLVNNTDYSADVVFVFNFYEYNSDSYVESVTVEMSGIESHQEYTVRCNLPTGLRNGYTVYWTSIYTDVYGGGLN